MELCFDRISLEFITNGPIDDKSMVAVTSQMITEKILNENMWSVREILLHISYIWEK